MSKNPKRELLSTLLSLREILCFESCAIGLVFPGDSDSSDWQFKCETEKQWCLHWNKIFSHDALRKWKKTADHEGHNSLSFKYLKLAAAAAAKSLQFCPTLCDPIDGSPPGSPLPGILQARTLEWVAIASSNAWKWKVKVKSLSRVRLLANPWLQPTRLLRPWDFPGKSTGVGCHCLLRFEA